VTDHSPLLSMHEAVAEAESARGKMAPAAPPTRARVALLGARGYAGLEFLRLATGHPGIEIAALASRELAGEPADALAPGLDGRSLALPAIVDPSALAELHRAGAFDTVVACWSHGAFSAWSAEHEFLARVRRIVDLSGDHRDERDGFRYGLPEAGRARLAGATRIANPGCYATAAILALLPALERRAAAGPACLTALSGASGAGRAPKARTSFVELTESAAAYKAGTEHAHVPEIARAAERAAGSAVAIAFTPQIVPMSRGILLTAYLPLAAAWSPEEARAVYAERYADEPFVRLLPAGRWPETGAVRGTNRCDLAVTTLFDGRTLLAVAAIDNLVKGAAGQAVQNLNLMLGWPETTALPVHASPW
jgi:N-acetyl-gamma-glutamyl-phosphate reductase